ncbi:MAG TPA: ABC transporter permease [Pyrinomonadaceae bacterium]|nr:ABC transporter permease [Pyrinomonadaceae bacterium]
MGSLLQDLRYGLQMLLTHRAFTAIAVLTIAIGVGANTALFSVVDAVLLKKLPVNKPDELVLLNATWNPDKFSMGGFYGSNRFDRDAGVTVGTSFPLQTYKRLRQEPGALSDVFAFSDVDMNLNTGGQAEVVSGQAVSGNYYSALGVPAIVGRTLTDADDYASSAPVAVLSHRFWTERFNADPSIVGKQVNINNVAFTIAGVTPPEFVGTMDVGSAQDVTIPIAWEPQISGERSLMSGAGLWWLRIMGRLKPGATIAEAQASLAGPFQQSVLEHHAARSSRAQNPLRTVELKDMPRLGVDSGSQGEMNWRREFARPLRVLFGVVALVLLIACANVANLLLVRASSRRKEIAVRLALGASRARLVRQLMTESILLAVAGGGLGILFALWIKDGLLVATEWGGRQMSALTPQLDLRVLGFTLGLTFLTGIIFGIVPALRATRLDLTPTLKDTGRSSSVVARSWLSRSLVVVQVSVSVLLLIGAGLLVKTLRNLKNAELGFNANNLLLFSVDPSLIGYREEQLARLYEQMFSRLEAVPGVESVTFSRHPLLAWSSTTDSVYLPHMLGPDGKPRERIAKVHYVRENFLPTMEIPLLSGRQLTDHDNARAPRVAVVNKYFALVYFGGDLNPVGKRFSFDPEKPGDIEIVGMAEDAKYTSQRQDIEPTVYLPWRQTLRSVNRTTFEVRTKGDPLGVVSGVREAVREVDGNLPVSNVRTQLAQADETLSMERLFAKLLALFGLIAQLLAAIGLYGVMAYSVSQRTQEIGIRMALGANRGNVLRMVLRQGMVLTIVGVAIGVGAAFVLTKYLETLTSMLFGIEARDPVTFIVIPVGLVLVALVACLVPARRATKVNPLVALRYE